MDTQKVASEYRLSKWAQVIQTRLNSGQSIQEFCQSAGISRNTYFYWQRKLREAACTELVKTQEHQTVAPGGWIELASTQAQPAAQTLVIEIKGCSIIVNAQTDSELLKKVCHTLRSL